MNEKKELLINAVIAFFNRFQSEKGRRNWFLDKQTLLEFVCNRRLTGKIHIGLSNVNVTHFLEGCFSFGLQTLKMSDKPLRYKTMIRGVPISVVLYHDVEKLVRISSNKEKDAIMRKDQTMNNQGIWRYLIDEIHHYSLPVPYLTGEYLDKVLPRWFHNFEHVELPKSNEAFIVGKRRENALELMKLLKECAQVAKIEDHLFVGFGTLLGIAREGGFISNDKDMDHCLMGHRFTKDQENVFLREISRERRINGVKFKKGLYEGRCRKPQRRKDNSRFLWTSVGHLKPVSQEGVKSCIWSFFQHGRYAWHSKGGKWVNLRKFNGDIYNYNGNEDAIAKGIPSRYLERFVTIDFKGVKVNVPENTGACLDVWYPGWARPKRGCSVKKHVLIVPDWTKSKGWKVV